MYYLQSRYYNPEWGRFINADGIIGQTGELLGHNLFSYSKNNPINMRDTNGFRPEYTLGEETDAMREASLAVMATAASSSSSNSSTANKSSSGFNPVESAAKGATSGGLDIVGGAIVKAASKKTTVGWKDFGGGLSKAIKAPVKSSIKYIKAAGYVGTAGFCVWDVGNDLVNGEYYSVLVDVGATLAGVAIGAAAGAIAGTLITVSTPLIGVIAIGAGAFILTTGAGVVIDMYATANKKAHYGR